jgi:hypothetical protein
VCYPPASGKSATTRERPMQEDGEEEEASAEAEEGNGGGGESETPSSGRPPEERLHRRRAALGLRRHGYGKAPPETFPGKFRSSYAHFCTFCFTFRTMSKLYHLNFTFRTQNSNSNHCPNILSKSMATFHLGSTAALFLPNHCPS